MPEKNWKVDSENTPDSHYDLLSVSDLAQALGRHRNYVSRMRKLGFKMPGGVSTIVEARTWLAENPAPRSRKRSAVDGR